MTKEETEAMVELITQVHSDIISASTKVFKAFDKMNLPRGGWTDVRDHGGLHKLAYNILSFEKENPKKHVISLATDLIWDVATEHYFFDGNKRTAFVLAGLSMYRGGMILNPDYMNAVDFLIKVAQKKANKSEIKVWLLENSKSIEDL